MLLLMIHHSIKQFYLKRNETSALPIFFGCITLRKLSLIMLLLAVLRSIYIVTIFSINRNYEFLDTSKCNVIMDINFSWTFSIKILEQIFVVFRSRLGATDFKSTSIWFKIGILLILIGVFNCIYSWVSIGKIVTTNYMNGHCDNVSI